MEDDGDATKEVCYICYQPTTRKNVQNHHLGFTLENDSPSLLSRLLLSLYYPLDEKEGHLPDL